MHIDIVEDMDRICTDSRVMTSDYLYSVEQRIQAAQVLATLEVARSLDSIANQLRNMK